MASLKYKPTCKKYESIKCLYKVIIDFTFWGSNDKHIFSIFMKTFQMITCLHPSTFNVLMLMQFSEMHLTKS